MLFYLSTSISAMEFRLDWTDILINGLAKVPVLVHVAKPLSPLEPQNRRQQQLVCPSPCAAALGNGESTASLSTASLDMPMLDVFIPLLWRWRPKRTEASLAVASGKMQGIMDTNPSIMGTFFVVTTSSFPQPSLSFLPTEIFSWPHRPALRLDQHPSFLLPYREDFFL